MKNLKKLALTTTAIIAFVFSVSAQKNYLKDADVAYDHQQWFNSIELYKQAYTKVKKADVKSRILFRTASAYQRINDLKGAETYYNKAIKAKYPDPVAILNLADVLKAQQRYPEAIVEYNNYKKEMPSDVRGENGVKSCELAQQWKDAKNTPETRLKIENMALLNSKESDFSPAYADKKYTTLIFTSTRQGAQGTIDVTTGQNKSDLYEVKLDKNGKWSTPAPLATTIASKLNEASVSVSKKGDVMFLTRCPEAKGKQMKAQLYVCKKQGPSWAEPELLPFCIDTINYRHPSISADGNTLYFDSRLSGGYGANDIWMSTYDKKAKTWGQPVNLGPSINTSGVEGYPYIADDDKTLYFSSDTHLGMGGLDLFRAEKDANGKFTKAPENLKSPMNSAGDDFGIIFEGKKIKGYFSSNREGGKGSDDIYSFILPPLNFNLTGTVVSSENNEPVTNALIHLKGSNGDMFEFKTAADGKYNFKLKENTSYEVTVATDKSTVSQTFKLGFLANKDMGKLTTVDENESKDFVKDFALTPVKAEIRFPAVLYALGKADLLVDPAGTDPSNDTHKPLNSKDSLNFLYQTLIDNPTIIIELQAHTDSRGNDAKNQTLSEARAKSCVDYLVNEKKIPIARLQSKGWGEKKLLVKDDVINKAKTKEEKNALHQKNRRTVFRIVSWDYVDPNAPKSDKPIYKPQVKGEENSESIEDNETK
ncbi:MAG: PD40 domain-containing protein [Bacteroidetes bacterium]|nr:PD40 domain-containing protein [Bacteroidota bacterium]